MQEVVQPNRQFHEDIQVGPSQIGKFDLDYFHSHFISFQMRDAQKINRKGVQVTDKELKKDEIMIKRLIVAICLLLKENPVLPLSFNFGGECLLQRLKREKENLRQL